MTWKPVHHERRSERLLIELPSEQILKKFIIAACEVANEYVTQDGAVKHLGAIFPTIDRDSIRRLAKGAGGAGKKGPKGSRKISAVEKFREIFWTAELRN